MLSHVKKKTVYFPDLQLITVIGESKDQPARVFFEFQIGKSVSGRGRDDNLSTATNWKLKFWKLKWFDINVKLMIINGQTAVSEIWMIFVNLCCWWCFFRLDFLASASHTPWDGRECNWRAAFCICGTWHTPIRLGTRKSDYLDDMT